MTLELNTTLKKVTVKIPYGTKVSEFMETLTLLDLEDLEDWTIDIQYIPTLDISSTSTGIVYNTEGVQFSYTTTNK